MSPSANPPGGPGTKGGSYQGTQLPVEPGKPFSNSRTRHGTPSGHRKHLAEGDDPCEPCRIAKSQYDARQLGVGDNTKRNRLHAKAQRLALGELRHNHEEEYRKYYIQHRDRLYAEEGIEQKQKQSFKGEGTWK